MEKRHISGHEVMRDINSGMDDRALMEKYKLSGQEINLLMKKLVRAKLISETELSELQLLWAQKRGAVWHCPACRMPQSHEFEECPQCGIIVAKFKREIPQDQNDTEAGRDETQRFVDIPPEEPGSEAPSGSRTPAPSALPGPNPTCSHCGISLPPDAKFCTSCGTKVSV
ncbi:MAG: zinc ribbon domain-containing protein [Desulfomonilaceae bacterium]